MLNRLSTENNDASKPMLINLQPIFQDPEFKHYIFSYIKARGSIRVRSASRLLNKEMNKLLQQSLTEVHIGYQHLQKLSQSIFKDTIKIIKVTINNQNRKINNEQVFVDGHCNFVYIYADDLQQLSSKIFKNVKIAEVILDESIDNLGGHDLYMCIFVHLDESLCLKNLRIVNQSKFCSEIEIYGKRDQDLKLEISNSQFEEIGLQCGRCKFHVHDIKIINKSNSSEVGWIGATNCIQSIFEGISIEGVADCGVYADECDTIQLRNISIKNCSQIDGRAISFEKCQNLDIQNISIRKSKIEIEFDRSNGCIKDSIIETSTHGIILKNSQIKHRNVIISCDDDEDVFKMDEESRWMRL